MDVDGETSPAAENSVDSVVESIRERLALLGPEAWGGAAPSAGRFEWVDGVLLQAATNGEWVLLENANLCSPTVLDRLNPLLETGGSLLVSECGHGADGEPRVVRAHPEFRLFLALDPRRGEVSRAMRNRGVEVFMDAREATSAMEAEETLSEKENARDFADGNAPREAWERYGGSIGDASLVASPRDDLEGILAAAGVPAGAARRAMADAHLALVTGDCVEAEPLTSGSVPSVETEEARCLRVARARASAAAARFAQLTHREAKTWAALTLELLSRGVGAEAALRRSWTHVYARGEASEQARRFARVAFETRVKPFVDATRRGFGFEPSAKCASAMARSTLIEPLGWPDSAAGEATTDVASRARRAGALLETVAGTLAGRERAESDDEYRVPNLALAAFPLRALRRHLALGEEAREDTNAMTDAPNGVVSADASVSGEASASESTRLLHLLRASGHAFLCGVAHGARGGLTRDALRDAAAWLRRLARRFEEPTNPANTQTLSKPKTLNQGDFERDSLGASAELQALARAAEALASHDVTAEEPEAILRDPSQTRNDARTNDENETMKTALRAVAARGLARLARGAAHTSAAVSLAAVTSDVASALQLSVAFVTKPETRGRGARAHALVDALAPALEAAAAFELAVAGALAKAVASSGDFSLKNPGPTKDRTEDRTRRIETEGVIAALRDAQDWRLRLEALARSTPARAMRRGEDGSPPDATATQNFATAYHLLRAAMGALGDAAARRGAGNVDVDVDAPLRTATGTTMHATESNDGGGDGGGDDAARTSSRRKKSPRVLNREEKKAEEAAPPKAATTTTPALAWETWRRASAHADAALGVPAGDPPAPLLWRHGGRPAMPRSALLRVAEDRTRALCAALQPGAEARAAAPAAAASLETPFSEAATSTTAALAAAADAAAAAVGTPVGASLRAAALEGLCFFAWTHAPRDGARAGARVDADTDASRLEADAGAIPATLAAECAALAASAACAGTATTAVAVMAEHEGARDFKHAAALDTDAGGVGSSAERLKSAEPPPAYALPGTALLRSSSDFLPKTSPASATPALGFPAWSRKWPACANAHDALLPLLELHSLETQPFLLADLSRLCVEAGTRAETLGMPSAATLAAAEAGLRFGIGSSPRAPSDFEAHRHVVWLAEELFASQTIGKEGDKGMDNTMIASARAKWREALPTLAHAAWRSWHAASWGGVADAPEAVAPLAPKKRKSTSMSAVTETHLPLGTRIARRWLESIGPARSEGAPATALAAALVAGSPPGVASRAARILQMRLASRALRLRKPSAADAASGEWASLGALAAHVVLAHVSAARDASSREEETETSDGAETSAAAALRESCAALAAHCAEPHARRDGSDASETITRRFETAAATVRHAPFRSVAETLVAPLVASLAAGAEARRARVVAEEDVFSVFSRRRRLSPARPLCASSSRRAATARAEARPGCCSASRALTCSCRTGLPTPRRLRRRRSRAKRRLWRSRRTRRWRRWRGRAPRRPSPTHPNLRSRRRRSRRRRSRRTSTGYERRRRRARARPSGTRCAARRRRSGTGLAASSACSGSRAGSEGSFRGIPPSRASTPPSRTRAPL